MYRYKLQDHLFGCVSYINIYLRKYLAPLVLFKERRSTLTVFTHTKRKTLNPDSPSFNPNELLTPLETSQVLSISVATLSVWRCTGRYQLHFVKCGRLIRYRAADVCEFLKSRRYSRTGSQTNG